MGNILTYINEMSGVISLLVSIVTMVLTMRINSKIRMASDNVAFRRERETIISSLKEYKKDLDIQNKTGDELREIILMIGETVEKLKGYNIWSKEEKEKIDRFKEKTNEIYRAKSFITYNVGEYKTYLSDFIVMISDEKKLI